MSNSDNTSEGSVGSSLIESIVPMQQIANLENDRKEKLNIPHRQRVKKSIITHQTDTVKLDRSGKCATNKSALPTNRIPQNLTCARCNVPIIQTDSGKIKPFDDKSAPLVTSHGDNDRATTFYKKPLSSYKTINKEAGDATFGSFKILHINRWLKLNLSRLVKDKTKTADEEVLKKYTSGSRTEITTKNEVVYNMAREAQSTDFPFSIDHIAMPKYEKRSTRELYATPGGGSDSGGRCCGDMCHCCKLACRIFGCRCKSKMGGNGGCCSGFPERTISLNVLERAHLQNLYNTPCSSIQFSLCNCDIQNALVKENTTAAHYFAHKGLRQVGLCGRNGRSVCSSSSYSNTEYRSQKSYVAVSLKSAVRQDYNEDDDCCCKCCDIAMVSIDCQTDSRHHLQHLVQTEPQQKKCRPCCKCCRCNRQGGRSSRSCKHFQIDNVQAGTSQQEAYARQTKSGRQIQAGSTKGVTLNRKRSPPCCNKCTGAPYRFPQIAETQDRVESTPMLYHAKSYRDPLCADNTKSTVQYDLESLSRKRRFQRRYNKCFSFLIRARGGADILDGSCASCNHRRLTAGTNNELIGQVVPGNEERFNIGNQGSWLSKKNITRLLGIDKQKTKKGFAGFGQYDVCNVCKFNLKRQPNIAKRFNKKINKRQLNRLMALRNLQEPMMLGRSGLNELGQLNNANNLADMNYDFLGNRHLFQMQQKNLIDQLNQQQMQDAIPTANQYASPINNRNFQVLNHLQSPADVNIKRHRHSKHHNHTKYENHNHRRTLIYKTHSTQCMSLKTHDQGTSCMADFSQAVELGYNLNVLPTVKLDKYRRLYNDASGKFRSPMTGREYSLKLEKVNYKSGVVKGDLPTLLEIDDKFDKLPKIERYNTNLLEYKENNDKMINAICDAILLAKDIGAAGETGYGSISTVPSSSNTINKTESIDIDIKSTDKINEQFVYRTNTIVDHLKQFNDRNHRDSTTSELVNLFIQSNPNNNIFTNKNVLRNNSGDQLLKSAIFRSKNRLNSTSSTSLNFSKIRNNTNMSCAEFKSFIMNDDMFRKSTIKQSSRILEQYKSYQLNNKVKNSEVITKNPMKNVLEDYELMQNNVPNFIHQNLSCFSNCISDTYPLIKILERNQEKLSNRSFDEQIENIINYNSFITDNS